MSFAHIMRLFRPDGLWFWVWNGIVTLLMVMTVLFVQRNKAKWTRGRRLLRTELRLEAAWEHTKEALQLPAAHRLTAKEKAFLADVQPGTRPDGVLSNLGGRVTQQSVQQSKISCDI
jgi:hypothetical protein